MIVVSPLHRYYSAAHLDHVAAQMRQLGAPRLRGYHDAASGCWLLAEGTHRIRAAKLLGIAPVLIPVPWWRSAAALERARFAAVEYGYLFPVVDVASDLDTDDKIMAAGRNAARAAARRAAALT